MPYPDVAISFCSENGHRPADKEKKREKKGNYSPIEGKKKGKKRPLINEHDPAITRWNNLVLPAFSDAKTNLNYRRTTRKKEKNKKKKKGATATQPTQKKENHKSGPNSPFV